MATTTAPPGEGLTIHAAAAALGMRPSTVRRHIKEGRLHATQRPTTQGYEWRVFPGDYLPTAGAHLPTRDGQVVTNGGQVPTSSDQVATTNDADDDYVLTGGEQGATTGEYLPTTPPFPPRGGSGASPEGSTANAGAPEPIEARYRVTPAEIEQAVERTSVRYIADIHTLFDRVSAEVGRLYAAQLAAKDQALAAQDGRISAQQETIAELRRRAEAAEAARLAVERERDDLRARLSTMVDTQPPRPVPPSQAVGGQAQRKG